MVNFFHFLSVVCLSQGEKYLVLKKKYRQLLQERHAEHHGTHGDGQRRSSPARVPATVQWEVTDTSAPSLSQKELQDRPGFTATDTRDHSQEVNSILFYSILFHGVLQHQHWMLKWSYLPDATCLLFT